MISFLQMEDAAPANKFVIVYAHPAADRDLKWTLGGHTKARNCRFIKMG